MSPQGVRHLARPVALVVGAAVLAAACSSADTETADTVEPAPVTTAAPSTTATPTTAPATVPPTTAATTTAPPATSPITSPPTTAPAPAERPAIDDLISSGELLNIAHAGGDQEWPHSTFYAYDRAVAVGADVLEMDVQLTGDGVLVVQHDDTVDGTTNGTGRVDAMTFDEIAALDAAHWYSPGCWPCRDLPDDRYTLRGVRLGEAEAPDGVSPDDLRIVSFAELVERYPSHPLDVEIKGSGDAAMATADELARLIDEYDLTDHIVVVSFDVATVEYFHSIAPDVHVSPGVDTMVAWLLAGVSLDPIYRIVQVPPEFDGLAVITPDFWDEVEAAGVTVWMWPSSTDQENAEFYQEMIDQGVRGIIAGRPTAVESCECNDITVPTTAGA